MELSAIDLKPLPDDFEAREIQNIAIKLTRDSFLRRNRRVIMHMSTGVGKTILAGIMFREVFKKSPTKQCWFIAPRINLLNQTKNVFEEIFGFDCGIVQANNPLDLSKHVQIATIQTLAARLNSDKEHVFEAFNNLPVSICAIDEAHLKFKGHTTIKDAWNPHMIGLTGTPFSKYLGQLWQDLVRPKSMVDAMNDGIICDYRVKVGVAIDRKNLIKSSTGEYTNSSIDDEVGGIIADVYREWRDSDDMKGRRFIGFVNSIASCIALTELFNNNNANTAFVHSKMSDDDVQAVIDALKAGMLDGVWSVIKLAEGFDDPKVSAIINCTPYAPSKDDPNIPNAACRYVQAAMRGTRKKPNGFEFQDCLIHDHSGSYLQFGPYELIEKSFPELHSGEEVKPKVLSINERLERVVKECSNCGFTFKGKLCDVCGHVPKKPTQFLEAGDLEFINGEMVEVKSSEFEPKKGKKIGAEDKLKAAQELKGWCKQQVIKNPSFKSKGVYFFKFKELTGKHPGGDYLWNKVSAKMPSPAMIGWIKSRQIAYSKRGKK